MKHELQAVTYRNRLMISLRYVGAVGIMGVLVTLVLLVRGPGILERWPWVFLLLICTSVAIEAYRARGPDHSGFVEVTSTALTHCLNGHLEVINFATATKVICFGILGNKIIILKTGSDWKEIVYSAYSNDLIHEFRRVLGPRLKEGLFEWVKTWYDR
jgi:hypothetical protein